MKTYNINLYTSLSLSLSVRVLLRVRMLYYLRQEVIRDQAERILEGAEYRWVERFFFFFHPSPSPNVFPIKLA